MNTEIKSEIKNEKDATPIVIRTDDLMIERLADERRIRPARSTSMRPMKSVMKISGLRPKSSISKTRSIRPIC